jgi:hypothetical protein
MILNGVYTVADNQDVHLIELIFDSPPEKIDVGLITQTVQGQDEGDWQTPWDEKYLDEKGENIIDDYAQRPTGQAMTRLIFFFHFLDFSKPLFTPNGPVRLTRPTSLPQRLADLITYEKPD